MSAVRAIEPTNEAVIPQVIVRVPDERIEYHAAVQLMQIGFDVIPRSRVLDELREFHCIRVRELDN
jgi:hypothetical protein